ncbi:hypothetical protein GCM10027429_33700 [Marivirga atlantica]|jgi:hypothetical protein|uniref:Uncharacterized protein n=1 Tax=Marivirga atlantica TaxID=1548457 RepID=A0A937AHP6_9BACT|nr:hypothetical protein [Marivirga atlantica]MBL0766951.1 hypothetical protein [Marivirga atlantica]
MENISVFYRILNEDLSPLIRPSNTQLYVDYLKEKFPEAKYQLKIKLSSTIKGYIIHEWKESRFSNIESSSVEHTDDANFPDILDFLTKELKIDNQKVINQILILEGQYSIIELLIKDDYQALSGQKIKFYYYQETLFDAYAVITKQLNEKIFKLKDEEQIRLYIRKNQTLMIGYMKSILNDYIPKKEWNSLFQISEDHTTTDIFKLTYHSLEDILVYIEKSFGHYLDTNLPVPYQSRLLLAIKHAEKLGEVLDQVERAQLDPELYGIVTIPFDRLSILEPLTFTYQSHFYHEHYLLTFHRYSQQQVPLNGKEVFLILWRLNFNALKFFNYLTIQIHKELKERETPKDKLELLYYYHKLCNQLPVKTHLSYNPNLLPLKDQMSIWLQEEINFQKRKLKYATTFSGIRSTNDKTLFKDVGASAFFICQGIF